MYYKTIKTCLLAAATLLAACTNLEEEPVALLSPDVFFSSPRDVETAVLGAYGLMASESYYGRKLTTTLMLRGDMGDIGDRGTPARRQQVNDFDMDSNNGMITAFWPQSYEIISAANAAIAGAERLRSSDLTESEATSLNELEGEARFVRAFAYYHLVRLFGEIPYIDFLISNPQEIVDISKTSVEEVYASIIEDLEFGEEFLPDLAAAGARSRASRGAAIAYLASVHLTRGNYQEAYDAAKRVIDEQATFNYGLATDYQSLFDATLTAGLREPIFFVDFKGNVAAGGGLGTDWLGTMTGIRGGTLAGWSVIVPNFNVYETWDDRDYRKRVSFNDSTRLDGKGPLVPYDSFQQTQRPHIAKYDRFCGDNRGDCGQSDNNYYAMRYAEVLLTAAEALNEVSGPTDEAIGYVNQIRARARNTPEGTNDFPTDVASGISQDDFRDLVLEERRLELSFEFGRWYDIKRRQLGEEAFLASDALEPHPNFDPSRDYLFPLPGDELIRNENLGPQNPGY